jgi:hypothetical protein
MTNPPLFVVIDKNQGTILDLTQVVGFAPRTSTGYIDMAIILILLFLLVRSELQKRRLVSRYCDRLLDIETLMRKLEEKEEPDES